MTVVAKKRKNLAAIENHPSELWGYFSDFLIRRVRVFEPSCGSASLYTQSLRALILFASALRSGGCCGRLSSFAAPCHEEWL